MFNFKKERLVKDSIGQGSFGEVFPYQKNPEDFKWVVKRTKAKKIEDLLKCLPEIVLGFSCDHPCIVPVKGYSIESKDNRYNVYMKLPRMAGGSLADEIRRRSKKSEYYSEDELVKHFYSLVSAVDYLHSKKISHGDIKMNNILLDEKGNLKLCDIGSGKFVSDEDHYNTMTAANGAFAYRAPEIIEHERALQEYHLEGQDEKKVQLMENILKREHLYLADSWSLGLTMLEICLLRSRLVNAHNSVQFIEGSLQKIRNEAGKRYSDDLLEIVFDLLKTDPAQRLQASEVKTKLEENFKQILTEDFKASLGLQKQIKQEARDISSYVKTFHERANDIVKAFEDDKREKEAKLDSFEESMKRLQKKVDVFHVEIDKIKAQKKQEIEEICTRYEEDIQTLRQENGALLQNKVDAFNAEIEKIKAQKKQEIAEIRTKYEEYIQNLKQENEVLLRKIQKEPDQSLKTEEQVQPRKQRDEEAYRKKLEKVSVVLKNKWSGRFGEYSDGSDKFESKSKPYLSITAVYINDKDLKELTEDMIQECCKQKLWEEMDGLELIFEWPDFKVTDRSLQEFASQLGPRLSCNLKHLVMNMNGWEKITDDGLKEFAIQILPQLTNLQHLELHMNQWYGITDEGLKVFISQLAPNLTNVKHLALNMSCWKISDEGLIVLASQLLPKLASVHHLDLGMADWKITDEGLSAFAEHLGANFANLKTFKLNLCCCWKITSKSLDFLASQICENLINLQELDLNLRWCNSVTKSDRDKLQNELKKKILKVDI